jgi:hypothetical protein
MKGLISLALFLVAIAFPALHALAWLREGVWYPLPPFSLVFDLMGRPPPQTDWAGLQQMINYLLASPFPVIPGALAVICALSSLKD